jgi:hypothetical protein
VIGQAFEQTALSDILLHYTKGQSFITREIKAKIKFLSWLQHDPAVPDSKGEENISICRCNELQHHNSFIYATVLILYTLKPHNTLGRYILITELPVYNRM